MMYKTMIGLAAYNEQRDLPILLEKIVLLCQGHDFRDSIDVVVVNDGSIDETENILAEYSMYYPFIKYINHQTNLGLGCAINTIINYTVENYDDNDVLVTLDADNTHDPSIIPAMVQKLKRENLDMVIASRFTKGGREIGLSFVRKFFSRGAKAFFKLFFPVQNINDYSCGFRAYNVGYLKKAMEIYNSDLVTSSGFECMAEIVAKFSKIGVRAGEYPLILKYNLKMGRSHMKVARTIKGYFSLLKKVKKP